MAKKKEATVNDVTLTEVFAKYNMNQHVSFTDLKNILTALGGETEETNDEETKD